MHLELIYIILLIAVGQGFFLSLVLLFDRRRNWARVLLAVLFLAISLQLFDFVMLYSQRAIDYPHLVFWSAPFNFAFGPILYLYIRYARTHRPPSKKSLILHFLPFAMYAIYVVWLYHIHSIEYKQQFITQLINQSLDILNAKVHLTEVLFGGFMYGHFGIYMWKCVTYLREDSEVTKVQLRWLQRLWLITMLIGLFGLVQFLLYFTRVNQQPVTGYLAATLAITYIYYGAMTLFVKPRLLMGEVGTQKYQYSKITNTEATTLLDKLGSFMLTVKPYLDPNMSIKDLAKGMGESERHLSQVINEHLGKNFRDFLNDYRISEFKSQIVHPENQSLSLLGVAFNCGFNSKSAFNAAFKKNMGMTPSQYRKSVVN